MLAVNTLTTLPCSSAFPYLHAVNVFCKYPAPHGFADAHQPASLSNGRQSHAAPGRSLRHLQLFRRCSRSLRTLPSPALIFAPRGCRRGRSVMCDLVCQSSLRPNSSRVTPSTPAKAVFSRLIEQSADLCPPKLSSPGPESRRLCGPNEDRPAISDHQSSGNELSCPVVRSLADSFGKRVNCRQLWQMKDLQTALWRKSR